MKDSKQSNEAIEKATLSTIQAFEMLKELQTGKEEKKTLRGVLVVFYLLCAN